MAANDGVWMRPEVKGETFEVEAPMQKEDLDLVLKDEVFQIRTLAELPERMKQVAKGVAWKVKQRVVKAEAW